MNINFSRVNMYQQCPRLYYWRFVCDLMPKTTALPLTFGKAVHAGLAAHYSKQASTPHIVSTYDEACAEEAWLPAEQQLLREQQEYAVYVTDHYVRHYDTEPFQVLAPEVEGDIELGDHRYYFRADALISMKGNPWLLEHKTTSQLGSTFFNKFRNDGQISMYCYGIWKTLDMRPVGVLINAIRKSRKMDAVKFEREVVMRPQAQLEDYVANFTRQTDRIAHLHDKFSHEKGAWLMYTGACTAYHRSCDYLDLCLTDTKDIRLLFGPRKEDYVDEGGKSENPKTG